MNFIAHTAEITNDIKATWQLEDILDKFSLIFLPF